MKSRIPEYIKKNLSVRLSLTVVFAMTILLMGSLIVMLYYTRKSVKVESLHKAAQTLEGTVQRIDNVLLSVEQATGNLFFNLILHPDDPDFIYNSCCKIVESNPYVDGCAIAFKPYYMKGKEYSMTYVHRNSDGTLDATDSPVIQTEDYGTSPYTERSWFTEVMKTAIPRWELPQSMRQVVTNPIATFSLPIPGEDGKPVGVIGVDLSLNVLSQIVLTAKPSPNSYCTLVDEDGSFIVHPNSDMLLRQTDFSEASNKANADIRKVADAMLSGETGYKPFQLDGIDYLIFYKPFERIAVQGRSIERLGWSVGIIYPEDDIFGDYNILLYYVLIIAFIGLLLLFILSRTIFHHQLLPLRLLTTSTQHIANGNYNEPIPDSRQDDEIGQLQDHFQQMQQSLSSNISELEQMTATLQKRSEDLRSAYYQAKKADNLKTAFLHNMSNQMLEPASTLETDVNAWCDTINSLDKKEIGRLTKDIQKQGKTITELLNNLLHVSEEEIGNTINRPEAGNKEVSHD